MSVSTKKWILVADCDEVFRKSFCAILISHFGAEIEIVEVEDIAEAMSAIGKKIFHLIVTEMEMPKRNGGDLIEAARSGGFNETTPILLVSKTESLEVEKKFKFVNFVPKPIEPFEIAQTIRNLFQLGSTEKMISASIFNSLLDSSLAFLREALGRDDFAVGEMQFKKAGETVEAEHAAIINLMIGKVGNTFSVLSNNETLMKIRDGSEKISGSTLENICKSLGFVILKHVLTDCGIIDSNDVHAEDITQRPELLTNKQGICVGISAGELRYQVFATTGQD